MSTLRILRFDGQLDALNRTWIERELGQLEDFADDTFAILDVRNVLYLDSTFINALVRVRNRLAKIKPALRICLVATRDHIMWRLFEITNLHLIVPLYEDLPTARRNGLSVLPGAMETSAWSVARRPFASGASKCTPQRLRRRATRPSGALGYFDA